MKPFSCSRIVPLFSLLLVAGINFVANSAAQTAGAASTRRLQPPSESADLILHNGKIVTVNDRFTIQEAVAVRDGRILQVGRNADVLKRRGPRTEMVDLRGEMVLPGLIDSHAHPIDASLTEFDHAIPSMERIQDVLDYIQARTGVVKEGEWIAVRQVFITLLK
jgi:predicted amidohydrolase YtcJ